MPLLLKWGEVIHFSCACVIETVLILLIFSFFLFFFLNIWRYVVQFVYYYNCVRCCCGDVSKSLGDWNFLRLLLVNWELPPKSQLLEFLQHLEEDGCGGGGNDGGGRGGDGVFCLLFLLKSWSARGASHHPAVMATARLLAMRF